MTEPTVPRRRRSDNLTLREALLENPGVVLLLAFNVIILAVAIWGVVTTNHRAQEAFKREVERSAEGRALALDFISCLLGEQEQHRLNSYEHFAKTTPDFGHSADGPIEFDQETMDKFKASCDRIITEQIPELEDVPPPQLAGPPAPEPSPEVGPVATQPTRTTVRRTVTTARRTATTQRRAPPPTAAPAPAPTCDTKPNGKCRNKDKKEK